MSKTPEERAGRYTTEEARAILARAIFIENDHAELLSLADLTAAASEAGINSVAFQVAVAEHEQRMTTHQPVPSLSIAALLKRSIVLGAGLGIVNAGLIWAFTNSTAAAGTLTTVTMFTALVIGGSLSSADANAPRRNRVLRFELKTLGLFGGLGATLVAFFNLSPHTIPEATLGRLLGGLGLFWLFTSAIGGVIALSRSSGSNTGGDTGSGERELSIFARGKRYLARQLRHWSDVLLRYSHLSSQQPRGTAGQV